MPLTLIDTATTLVDDAGGEQTLVTDTATDNDAYVFVADVDALSGVEQVTIRGYVDYGAGSVLTVAAVIVNGTDLTGFQSDPIVVATTLSIEWAVVPSGWAADRNITWTLFKV